MEQEAPQCRICLAGSEEVDLGRLIKPCLCKGSISFVHVKCLQTWRNTSSTGSAFFACPQCKYRYRFARTRVVGIATNPIIISSISTIFFTALVMLSSFITTFFMSAFEEPSYRSIFFVSPFEIAQDLIRAALRILQDETGVDGPIFTQRDAPLNSPIPRSEPGLLLSFLRRFLIGLPMIGAGSIVQMLLSVGFLNPIHIIARYRSNNRRRGDSSRDVVSLIIIGLILIGAARALIKVYNLTEKLAKRLLLRAEDAILEV